MSEFSEKSAAALLDEFRYAEIQHKLSWNDLECTNLLLEIVAVGLVGCVERLDIIIEQNRRG